MSDENQQSGLTDQINSLLGGNISDILDGTALKAQADASAYSDFDSAMIYGRVFAGPDGQALLADLVRLFKDPPTWPKEWGLLNGIPYGFVREGQQSVIAHIQERLRRAAEGPPKE